MPNPSKDKKHPHPPKPNPKPKFTGTPSWAMSPQSDKKTDKGTKTDEPSLNAMSPLASPFSPYPRSSASAPALGSPAMELHRDVENLTGEEMFESIRTLDDEGLKQAMTVPNEYAHTPGIDPTEFSMDAPSSIIGQEMADMIPRERLVEVACEAMGALGAQIVVTRDWRDRLSEVIASPVPEKQTWSPPEREPSETTLTDQQEEEEYWLRRTYGDKILRHKLPNDPFIRDSVETIVTAVCTWLGMSVYMKDIVITSEYIAMHKVVEPSPDAYEKARKLLSQHSSKSSGSASEYYKGGTDVETPASTGGSEDDTRSEEAHSYKDKSKRSRALTPPPMIYPHQSRWGPLRVELHGHYSDTHPILLELPFPKYFNQIRSQQLSATDAVEYILVQEDLFEQYSTMYNFKNMKILPHGYFELVDIVSHTK